MKCEKKKKKLVVRSNKRQKKTIQPLTKLPPLRGAQKGSLANLRGSFQVPNIRRVSQPIRYGYTRNIFLSEAICDMTPARKAKLAEILASLSNAT